VADIVWARFGDTANYVEPFFGSGAVLLGRPHEARTETVNDKDGFIANAWRAIASNPEEVARWADWPVNEADQHARHIWLIDRREALTSRLMADPDYHDAKIAGWWLWGIACWIGSGWCSGDGPWQAVEDAEGIKQLVHLGDRGQGVHKQRVHLGNRGQGVHKQRVHLGNRGQGVHKQLVHLGDRGQGVHKKRVHLGNRGQGVHKKRGLQEWMVELSDRLRRVRVCCGDWQRICGPSVTFKHGMTGVFLDPPYSAESDRCETLYSVEDLSVAHTVRKWCVENQDNPLLRIALCGYEGEHDLPGWTEIQWKAHGGFGSQGSTRGRDNARRERIWFSPACLDPSRRLL